MTNTPSYTISLPDISDKITFRKETPKDRGAVYTILEQAFGQSDEAELVCRLRNSDAFIPDLSIVAQQVDRIVGYLLFTRVTIISSNHKHTSLALAPVAVTPELQSKGVGSALIEFGLSGCRELGYSSVIVLGHAEYYPRFGFEPAAKWAISCPFLVPSKNFMALELYPGALHDVRGVVRYAKEFDL